MGGYTGRQFRLPIVFFSSLFFLFFTGCNLTGEIIYSKSIATYGIRNRKVSGSEAVGTATKELCAPASYTLHANIYTYKHIYIHLFVCLLIFSVCCVPAVLTQRRNWLQEVDRADKYILELGINIEGKAQLE